MPIFRFDVQSGNLGIFKTKKEAAENGNGATFATEDDLVALAEISNPDLVKLHNSLTDAPVKKFPSRAVGARRVWALLELKASEAKAAEKAAKVAERDANAPKGGKKAKQTEGGPIGRASRYAGGKLHPVKTVNPRRAGTHGWKSYEIVREKPGVTYEDYIAAGGRGNDLQWDIDKGYIEVK